MMNIKFKSAISRSVILLLLFQLFALAGIDLNQASAAVQATIYVSPTGSDTGDGSVTSPYATLAKARDVVRTMNANMTGDIIVYLRGGTYNLSSTLTLNQTDSGTNGYNVVYQAYPGETPVVSGGVTIPNAGWSVDDAVKNIYVTDVSATLDTRQLYVNGVKAQRARGEDNPAGFTKTSTGYTLPTSGLYANMASWGNPSDMEIVSSEGPNFSRGPVASIASGNITMETAYFSTGNNRHEIVSWVENAKELLDVPGEFYLDKWAHKLYYIPRTGENLTTNAVVVAPVVENLIDGTGYSGDVKIHNIQLKGITFSYNTWLGTNSAEGYNDVQAGLKNGRPDVPISVDYIKLDSTKLEAEGATLQGTASISSDTNASGGQYVSMVNVVNIGNVNWDGVTFTAPSTATTQLTLRYATAFTGTIALYVNGVHNREIYVFSTGAMSGSSAWTDKIENVNIPANATVTIRQKTQYYSQVRNAAVKFGLADHITIDSCVFKHIGSKGVVLTDGTTNSSVTGSRFDDIALNGIDFGDFGHNTWPNDIDDLLIPENMKATNIQIQNNFISNVGVEYLSGIGIVGGYAQNSTVSHNYLTDLPYSAISIGYGWGYNNGSASYAGNNFIEYNYINGFMKKLHDGGGIYTLGKQTGSMIRYNYITNQMNQYGSIYLDNGTDGFTVTQNVVTKTPMWGYVQYYNPVASNNNVNNNNTDTTSSGFNGGSGNTYSANLTNRESWPLQAYSIIDGAGLQAAYSDLASGASFDELKVNVALNKTATSDVTLTNGTYATDGQISQSGNATALSGTGAHWIQLDLGKTFILNRVKVWHDYVDGRTYRDVIIQLSNDASFSTGVTTVFNNDTNNSAGQGTGTDAEYAESAAGKLVVFDAVSTRYIRVWSNGSNVDTTSRFVEVQAFQNPINVALSKTVVSSDNYSGYSAAMGADGGTTTKWASNIQTVIPGDKWLQVNLAGNYKISRWIVRHAGSNGESASLNTKDFKLQKSNDGNIWTDVDTVTGNTDAVTDRTTVPFNANYVRLYITAAVQSSVADNLNAARVYEFEVYGTPSVDPTNIAPSATASSTGASLANPAGNFNDGSIATSFVSVDNPSFPQYETLVWPTGQTFSSVTLKCTYCIDQGPTNWDIEVSDDGSTNWTKVANSGTVSWPSSTSAVESKLVSFPSVSGKKGLRVKINSAALTWRHFAITDLEVRMNNLAVLATASTDSGNPSNAYAMNDGNPTSAIVSYDYPVLPKYETLVWSSPLSFNKLALKCAYCQGQAPTSLEIEVSKDGSTNWTKVGSSATVSWTSNTTTVESNLVSFPLQQNVKGVRIKINAANLMWHHYSVNELEVYKDDVSPNNLAAYKTATTDSNNNSSYSGALAVDGSTSTKWASQFGETHWLAVDLGQSYDITEYVVKHAGVTESWGTQSLNTRDFKFQVSSDGTTWTDVDTVTGNTANITDHIVTATGRYVRLYITNPQTETTYRCARIFEFEVYGTLH